MKTIQLSAKQRQAIQERRRQARDRRICQRLSALLGIDPGRTRDEGADLLGGSSRHGGDWLRIVPNKGLDEVWILPARGDPARLRPAQGEQLKPAIAHGSFHNAAPVRAWIEDHFGVTYSASGVKDLWHRIGASYHTVSGLFLEGGPDEAASVRAEVSTASAGGGTDDPARLRRRLPSGLGPGTALLLLAAGRAALLRGRRQWPHAAQQPGCLSPRRSRRRGPPLDAGEQHRRAVGHAAGDVAGHAPATEKFSRYLDNAPDSSKPVVTEWLAPHRQFRLVFLPAYTPNRNRIERLWRFLRTQALNRWHKTFAARQEAVAEVRDPLERYHSELDSLRREEFHIRKDEDRPLDPAA